MDGHESPIKAWVKRHSPIKHRTRSDKYEKPLPPPPSNAENIPVHHANPSPTRQRNSSRNYQRSALSQASTNSENIQQAQVKSKKRISSVLKHKSTHAAVPILGEGRNDSLPSNEPRPFTPATRPATSQSNYTIDPAPSRAPSRNETRRAPSPTNDSTPKGAASRIHAHSPTLRTLTERVTSLESQLYAAKAEIASISHPSQRGPTSPRSRSLSSRQSPRSRHARRSVSIDANMMNREAEERQARLLGGVRYDGLVESLLAPSYEAATATASRSASRASMSSDRDRAIADYSAAEAAYEDDFGDKSSIDAPLTTTSKADLAARRRSEIRAASWKQVKDHIASQSTTRPALSKKRSRSYDMTTTLPTFAEESSPDQPPLKSQKQSHDPGARHARGGSVPLAAAPPRGTYYTTEQARTAQSQSPGSDNAPGRGRHARRASQTDIPRQIPSTIKAVPSQNQFARRSVADAATAAPGSNIPVPSNGAQKRHHSHESTGTSSKEVNGRDNNDMIDLDMADPSCGEKGTSDVVGEGFAGDDDDDDDDDAPAIECVNEGPPSPHRSRHVPSPSRLRTVREEFEWDDEVF